MLPLAYDTISLTGKIVSLVTSSAGFATVGKGLAAIFIFFHIGSCGISLFQEQKFRLKMLYPFIVFFIVCNFSVVSTPTLSVVQSITSSLCGSMNTKKTSLLAELGRDSDTGKTSGSMMEAMMNRKAIERREVFGRNTAEKIEENIDTHIKDETPISDETSEAADKGWVERKISSITGSIATEIMKAWEKMKSNFVDSLVPNITDVLKVNALGIIATVLQFIMDVMTIAMTAFGAMLTGILVAFGPITFALACFPEKLNVILHWFLRLLQYSLWAPIINLISTFVTEIYILMLSSNPGTSTIVGAIAAFVAAIVCLTQVPTIAGMIIEGVSGNASLSMGLSTIASTMTAPARLGSDLVMGGEGARDNEQTQLLRQIVTNTGGSGNDAGGGSNQAPSGLNTN